MSRILLSAWFCIALAPALAWAQTAGVSPAGEKGTLHRVVTGDTLWDITATYLGTPWIWPSIWKENEDIRNPHRIHPGDLIWITQKGMRKVSEAEAAELVRLGQAETPGWPEAHAQAPAAKATDSLDVPDPFSALDQGQTLDEWILKYPGLHRMGWVSPDQLAGSGAVMGSHNEHYWHSQRQRTIVSMGEGQVNVGDRFNIYRIRRRVLHPETGQVVGYFTQNLGVAEVSEIHPESSFVEIVTAYAEIEPGDRVTPYLDLPTEIRERQLGQGEHVKGSVVAQQPYRVYSGWNDFVVLDRGSNHGVQPGNRFNLYREGKEVRDPLTLSKVLVPDDVFGRVFVVSVTPNTSLALITTTSRTVREGDRFRDI